MIDDVKCPECGPGMKVDEDGCCAACGADIDSAQNPAPESVYERGRKAMQRLWRPGASVKLHAEVHAALDAGEAAEKRAQEAEKRVEYLEKASGELIDKAVVADRPLRRLRLILDPHYKSKKDLIDQVIDLCGRFMHTERERDEAKEAAHVADAHAKRAEEVAHQLQREREALKARVAELEAILEQCDHRCET